MHIYTLYLYIYIYMYTCMYIQCMHTVLSGGAAWETGGSESRLQLEHSQRLPHSGQSTYSRITRLSSVKRNGTETGSFFAAYCTCVYVFCCLCTVVGVAADTLYTVHVHVLMRCEKEERKKPARSNKKTKQSNTAHPRQLLFLRKMSCLGRTCSRVSWVRRKSDCLGCAVLLCLVVCLTLLFFSLPSFSHLSLHVHVHVYIHVCSADCVQLREWLREVCEMMRTEERMQTNICSQLTEMRVNGSREPGAALG